MRTTSPTSSERRDIHEIKASGRFDIPTVEELIGTLRVVKKEKEFNAQQVIVPFNGVKLFDYSHIDTGKGYATVGNDTTDTIRVYRAELIELTARPIEAAQIAVTGIESLVIREHKHQIMVDMIVGILFSEDVQIDFKDFDPEYLQKVQELLAGLDDRPVSRLRATFTSGEPYQIGNISPNTSIEEQYNQMIRIGTFTMDHTV